MDLFAQKAGFDRDQQVVGQHAEKDMSLHSILEVMEDRSLPEWTLEIAESILNSGYQDRVPPSAMSVEILQIRFEQIGAIHAKCFRLSLALLLPKQFPLGGVKTEP